MKIEIGAYEAKTKLPQLLRQVLAGKRYTITNRGKAIADLVPSESTAPRDKAATVEKYRTFLRSHPVKSKVNIKALMNEGRA